MQALTLFAILTVLSNLGLVVLIIFRKRFTGLIKDYIYDISLVVSGFAVLGSLFISNILYLPPCELCWYQRIFMYPIPIILLTAKFRKITKIWEVIIPLVVIGGLIGIYHYIIQLFPEFAVTCGFSTPCTDTSIKEFGFVTIPWMSISAFGWLLVLMLMAKSVERPAKNKKEKVL